MKLLFVVEPPVGRVKVERMWVEVVEATARGYIGRLDNDPDYLAGLACDDLLRFGPEHVAARHVRAGDPFDIEPDKLVIVSRRVWDEDAWPLRLERGDVPDPLHCGWIVFAGDEAAAYVADLDNFVPVPLGDLVDRFPVLDSGLEGPVGTTMAWDEQALEFIAVPVGTG